VSGARILDPSGAPIVLRGWNWGQWGTMQPQDAADNRTEGATVVRIPLRWWGAWGEDSVNARADDAPGHIEPGHLSTLDDMIDQAGRAGLWIDLFVDSNCGQASVANDTVDVCGTGSDGKPANFLNDADAKQKLVEVWQFLVQRYADKPYIGMYEILAEPNFTCSDTGCTDYGSAPAFYASIIPSIRALDPRTPILVGAIGGYDIRQIATAYIPDVPGLIYTGDLLQYGSSHPKFLTFATDFRAAKNVPLFIQQVGVRQSDTDAATTADTILSVLNGDGIGWTWWTYREHSSKGTGYAPYWLQDDGTWGMKSDWLALISGRL